MTGTWRVALRNLARTKRRNAATATAIACGTAGLILLLTYILRIDLFLRTNAIFLQHGGHVAIYERDGLERALARPDRHTLPAEAVALVRRLAAEDARVELAAEYLRGMGLAGNGCRSVPFLATGIDPEVDRFVLDHPAIRGASIQFARPLKGRPIGEATEVAGAVGLTEGLARLLGKPRVHDEFDGRGVVTLVPDCGTPAAAGQIASDANIQLAGLTFDGSLSAIDGEVVNLFTATTDELNNQGVVASLASLRSLYATDRATYVALYLHDEDDADAVADAFRTRLGEAGHAVAVYPFTDATINPYYVGSMSFLWSMVAFIVTLVAAVVGLGLMNAVTLTVFERSREIGTFRAVGYRRRQVVGLFLREMVVLAAAGVAGGIVLAYLAGLVARLLDLRVRPPGVPGEIQVVLIPTGVEIGLVAAAILPLAVVVTWMVARRRVAERTADLLTATTA